VEQDEAFYEKPEVTLERLSSLEQEATLLAKEIGMLLK
jgi:hypothetical protein